jgi:hypothetical protein
MSNNEELNAAWLRFIRELGEFIASRQGQRKKQDEETAKALEIFSKMYSKT